MTVIICIVIFIRGRALNHQLFKALLDELDSECGDIIYHAEVRWLSRGKVLTIFVALLLENKTFFEKQSQMRPKIG